MDNDEEKITEINSEVEIINEHYTKEESTNLDEEVSKLTDLLQRVQADSLNYKKRMEEEKNGIREQSTRNLLLKLLPILDDFERATEHMPKHKNPEITSWIEGIELLQKNITTILEAMGLERIEANGQEFNPTEHEAVLFQEVADSENTIIEVVRKGYNFNSKVLRASQVIVSKTKIETENSRENTFN